MIKKTLFFFISLYSLCPMHAVQKVANTSNLEVLEGKEETSYGLKEMFKREKKEEIEETTSRWLREMFGWNDEEDEEASIR